MKLKKAYVFIGDSDLLGIEIPKGTIYNQQSNNKDWYTPTIIVDKIPFLSPNYQLHFTVLVNNTNFIEIFK